MSVDPLVHNKPTRTDMYCHACSKTFIAELDYTLEGNHTIVCPNCQHYHYRKIMAGKVTEDRFDTDLSKDKSYMAVRVWKSDVLAVQTSSASMFIRQKWLEQVR